jgi:hypothetical protein
VIETATLAAILSRLASLETRMAVLERPRRPRDGDDLAVLASVAEAVEDRHFSAREVLAHARVVGGPLREALEQADVDESPRSLGRLFRRLEGRATDGNKQLVRVAIARDGIVWGFR